MDTAQSYRRVPPRALPRTVRATVAKSLAAGLAVGLIAAAGAPVGADPRGDAERDSPTKASEQHALRVTTEDQTSSRGPAVAEASPTSAASIEIDLAAAREEQSAALAALATLGDELDRAQAGRSAALGEAEAAQDALMKARIRLGDLIKAEDSAVSDLNRAAARVERERSGTNARRSAFKHWQMTAVAERAAHARRGVAGDIGASLFEALQAAEAALADAELALGAAKSAHLRAERSAAAATTRVEDLEAVPTPQGDSPPVPTTRSPRPIGQEMP